MTWITYRLDGKKLKKHWKVEIELSINYNGKSHQLYTLPQSLSMSEKNCGIFWFNFIIYWTAEKA